MKVRFKPSDYLEFEIEGTTQKDIFKQLASLGEIFTDEVCGVCKNEDTRYVVRTVDDNDFFEKKCFSCFSRIQFGQAKSGGSLFPKRKLEDGSYDKENQGWSKWVPSDDTETPKKKKK